jgi:hypothetical protein
MSSFFVHPWLLLALIGASIPIIIELLFRRRRRRVELPTIRYLLKNPPEKKIKRQDQLLLILRCCVPVFLAAALARPLLGPEGGAAVRKRHVMILMDSTISMGQQVGVSTAFALARNKAVRLTSVLPEGTEVSVVTLGHRPERRLERTKELYAARELVDSLKISHGAASMAEALPLLRKWMVAGGKKDEKQELFVFSDFQKTTWLRKGPDGTNPIEELRNLRSTGDVYLVDVGGSRPFNYYFTDFSPEEPLLVTGKTFRFRTTVEAKGPPPAAEPRARLTFLVNGEKKSMQEVPLKAGKVSLAFEHRFQKPGEYLIEVTVEGDTHRLDNRRYYLASVPESLKVLILDEGSGGPVISPEAKFLSAAVSPLERPGLDKSSIFTAKVLYPANIIRENLSDYSAVVLLGMERVSADLVNKLEPYVRDGGNALFFLSGRTNPWEYNEKLYRDGKGLLPARLNKSEDTGQGPGLGLKVVSEVHPAFALFADEKVFPQGELSRFMSLAAEDGKSKPDVFAYFTNGKPAILGKKLGKGHVVAFCMSAGPPESFMPASLTYPVLLQEMLRYLADEPDREVNLENGQTFQQDVMVSAQHLILRKPDNSKVRLTPLKVEQGDLLTVSFDDTDQMGLYEIEAQAGVLKRPRFVVNLQSAEGDLDRLEESDARKMFAGGMTWVRPGSAIEAIVKGKYSVLELAGSFLGILAALLVLESLLAAAFGLRRH